MKFDIAQLTQDEKFEVIWRQADRYGAALVPMDEPGLSADLVKYASWERRDWFYEDVAHALARRAKR